MWWSWRAKDDVVSLRTMPSGKSSIRKDERPGMLSRASWARARSPSVPALCRSKSVHRWTSSALGALGQYETHNALLSAAKPPAKPQKPSLNNTYSSSFRSSFIMEAASSSFHVAFLAVPFGSHASALFSLARHLATSLPSGTFSFFSTARSNSGLARTNSLWPSNLRSYDVHDGLPDGAPQLSPIEEIDLFLGLVPGNFSEKMAAVEEELGRVSCVVSDGFWGFAGGLAAERSALWVSYWNSAPRALLVHLYTDLLRQSAGTDGDRARVQDALDSIPGLSSLRIKDLPEGIVLSDTTSSLALQLHNMSQVIRSATVVVLNSSEGLDPTLDTDIQTKFKRCLNIGPFSLLSSNQSIDDKHGCLAWLDNQVEGSVVYISFGSLALPPEAEIVEIVAGLQASGAPFLWSMKEIAWRHLPADFLEYVASRGLLVPWAPQPQVLEHSAVGAFLTHSGWSSILESITGGVPMILRPFFGDQPLDARVVSDVWKIGVGFEGGVIKKDEMVNALNVILRSERGKTMKEKINELKSIVVQATKKGGSSRKNLDVLEKIVASCQDN